MRHWPLAIAVCAALLCAASPALSQTKKDLERAEAKATEGKAYFKGKLFAEAADAFMGAYAIVRKPTLVYNAARAREELGDHKRAIALFNMYVGLATVSEAGKKAAREHIAKLQAKVDAAEAAARAAEEQKKLDAAKKARAEGAATKAATAAASASRIGVAKGAAVDGERVFPLWRASGGGALALFAAAAQFNALRNADLARLGNLTATSEAAATISARDSAQLWQGVAIGTGVVAAGLVGWAAYDYFVAKTPKKQTFRALWVAPDAHGRWVLSARFSQ